MYDPTGAPWSILAASWEELFPLRPQRIEMAARMVPEGGRFLDAGCATGSLPRALAERGRHAHGLDLEPAFLTEARRRADALGLAVTWHLADLLRMEAAVAGERFDLVACLGQTLPHLLAEEQWLAFFGQARNVLLPGGRLVVQVVNDTGAIPGQSRELPVVRSARGFLERRRTILPDGLARMDTVFHPVEGAPIHSQVRHLRMEPDRAAELMRAAGLDPGPPMADETGRPFEASAPGWMLVATR